MKRRMAAVIVLYKQTPEESVSYRSLLAAWKLASPESLELTVMLADNSPAAEPPAGLPENVLYTARKANYGLSSAYNDALTFCVEHRVEWLLTLDQDTEMPVDFLSKLLPILEQLDQRPDVAAVAPQIRAGGRIVSPHIFAAGAWPRWFAAGTEGVREEAVYAFNSGAVLRVSALCQVGGYSPWFWLDNSDLHLFSKLRHFGKRVYIAGSLELQHEFSMLRMQEQVSPERYRTMLQSEAAFWDTEMGALGRGERLARLLVRLAKHVRQRDSPELRRITVSSIVSRVFHSRRRRLQQWRDATRARIGEAGLAEWKRPAGPMISVCMAAYKGERYIEAQLASVLPQLGADDEIVIVNDASPDRTVDHVRRLQAELAAQAQAPRIVLLEHSSNQGVVRTFENAMRSANGDILFLCDDDDLWAPEKVSRMLAVFAARPRVQIVCSGLSLIDENGEPLEDPQFFRTRSFSAKVASNFWHNQFQGSAMALRSSMLGDILPLPAGRLFLHDAWIGMVNAFRGGEAVFLDEPLLLYRRHRGNYSRKYSRGDQIRLRWQLLADILHRKVAAWQSRPDQDQPGG